MDVIWEPGNRKVAGLLSHLIPMPPLLHLLNGNLPQVQCPPSIANVGEDKGDEEGDDAHHLEREKARRAVLERQRILHLGQRGIIGCVIPAGAEQKGCYGHDRPDAGPPDSFPIALLEERQADAAQDANDAQEHGDQHGGHGQEVVQVFVRLHVNLGGRGINGKAVRNQPVNPEYQEEKEERRSLRQELAAAAGVDGVIVYIINKV